jgi:hypothetical protein
MFDLPLNKVQVYAPDPGGGFGGKQNVKFEPLLAHVSLRTGRPCRLVPTLEEIFQAVRRAASTIKVRSGFAGAGDLVFRDIFPDYLIGAYVDIADRVMTKGNYPGCGPYCSPPDKRYGKTSEQLDPAARQLAFEDLETAFAEAAGAADAGVARNSGVARNAGDTTRRLAPKRNPGHLPDHLASTSNR